VVGSLQVKKKLMHFPALPFVLHAAYPLPLLYSKKGRNYEAPHYKILMNFLAVTTN
jgi:hypothetical protein